jgi:hypothetical protein
LHAQRLERDPASVIRQHRAERGCAAFRRLHLQERRRTDPAHGARPVFSRR